MVQMLQPSLYGFAITCCLFLAGFKRQFICFFYLLWYSFSACLYKSSQLWVSSWQAVPAVVNIAWGDFPELPNVSYYQSVNLKCEFYYCLSRRIILNRLSYLWFDYQPKLLASIWLEAGQAVGDHSAQLVARNKTVFER